MIIHRSLNSTFDKLLYVLMFFFITLMEVDTHDRLKIEVWDSDFQYDDKLTECMTDPIQGSYKWICKTPDGNVEVEYELTCDDHLTGIFCNKYKPQPNLLEILYSLFLH